LQFPEEYCFVKTPTVLEQNIPPKPCNLSHCARPKNTQGLYCQYGFINSPWACLSAEWWRCTVHLKSWVKKLQPWFFTWRIRIRQSTWN